MGNAQNSDSWCVCERLGCVLSSKPVACPQMLLPLVRSLEALITPTYKAAKYRFSLLRLRTEQYVMCLSNVQVEHVIAWEHVPTLLANRPA
jgi:hypothetical protein